MSSRARPTLNRERILRAAVDLADREGLDALTMRRLGTELGVEAMSLYKHVSNKGDILDGILEFVVAEIDVPSKNADWRESMRRRAISARTALTRHSWAIGLLETRGPTGPTALGYLDAVLGSLRATGFSIDDAAHAFWLLDSYVYGHVVQEIAMTFRPSDDTNESAASSLASVTADEFPHLVEVARHSLTSEYDFDREFEFGLDLILDALGRIAVKDTSP